MKINGAVIRHARRFAVITITRISTDPHVGTIRDRFIILIGH